MINKYKRILNNDDGSFNIWPTFTDMLASILLIIILIVCYQSKQQKNIAKYLSSNVNSTVEDISKNFDVDVKYDKATGSVIFFVEDENKKSDKSMFNVNDTQLTKEGKAILKKFIPQYVKNIYSNKEVEKYISKIVIEGHTDDDGSYLYNLELSQERAFNVVKYVLGDEIGDYEYKSKLEEDLIAVGRSKAELIMKDDGSIDKNKSRRVEIKYEINSGI